VKVRFSILSPVFFFLLFLAGKTGNCQVGDTLQLLDTNETAVNPFCYIWLQEGAKFPDTYFYDTTGKIVKTSDLFKGKPVIFITGSYTCPGFRNNAKRIRKETRKRSKTHDIYFVYLHEAHPIKGSPYGPIMDNYWVNVKENIYVERQKYLYERLQYARMVKREFEIISPVIADNEHNDFFLQVFSGPNGFVEFSADRVLVKQRAWFFNRIQKRHTKKRLRQRARKKFREEMKWIRNF
jgi:hypothetical protein